jgi:hypothetical protein
MAGGLLGGVLALRMEYGCRKSAGPPLLYDSDTESSRRSMA